MAVHNLVKADMVGADAFAFGISLGLQYRVSLRVECQSKEDRLVLFTLPFLQSDACLELVIGKGMVMLELADPDMSLHELSGRHDRVVGGLLAVVQRPKISLRNECQCAVVSTKGGSLVVSRYVKRVRRRSFSSLVSCS